ncbi:putative sodium-dependent multivitamin transporter [Zeugodacus cucurbitae]|uniref:Putative sodium-dependent multivitamin transporter n=1 Tax=Zeugodacus cucurbitae TaxID=28588 RepID=A0A0A1X1T3_ZEUCU|nr:putative sodium-dependent multivitamin transporter [Zeugodacus cucurbitae]XP_054088665.1 putative sodium-dependent multivitamin transporter [Zeugodacus cucurbitae]XP_054088666.1 putative sodium-dependent multivitamin transporter [Zeugodacus cucurbitae]XP_054088667.1 putative sodium-dependent multivitamin transporter [Zeugodacus cucurbitae]XP_054088668.1 putative sodium-dependent multivitamin transporter [Zeugodacus cucurbitae]XP_054088669.1 putative sodium-dependent multivitamin transporter
MEPTFDGWDFAVLITILAISAMIGIYYRYTGGKQKTIKEYLLADQSMTTFPVAVSLMASFMSSITLLGVSSESYQFGTMFCVINLAYLICTPIAAYLFLPVFYRMRTMSVYEYLERRFGHSTRLAASLAYSVQMILYMGIVLYAPALALEAVTGVNKVTAILVIGLICTFYSTIGGLKAVLITDVFQSLLMFAAIYAVIVVSAVKAGGLAPIWQVAEERSRVYFTEFSLDPTVRHTWWSLLIGGMVTYLSLYGVNQVQVQRLLSVRNLESAQAALWWNLPILGTLSFSTLFSGLAIFHYYRNCDPLLEGRIQSRDQLMPLFAVDTMGQYPGLCGLFVSGIFSASLSTVSSAVSSLSTVTLEDYIKPLYKHFTKSPLHDTKSTLPSKIMACIYGLVCIGMAFTAGSMGGVLQASLTIFGIIGGPLLALFTLGLCTTRANQRGVLLGLLIGFIFSFIIGFGGPKQPPTPLDFKADDCPAAGNDNITLVAAALTQVQNMTFNMTTAQPMIATTPIEYNWFYRLSYLWFSVIGFLITTFMGYVLSLLLETLKWADNKQIYLDYQQIDVDLFIPPLARRLRKHNAEEMTKL